MALGRIEDLMRQAYPWSRIVAIMSTEGYSDSDHTLREWRQEVMKRWAKEDAETRPARKDLWRARLEHLYQNLCEKAEAATGYPQAALFSEAIKVAKLSIILDGAQAPIVVKHEGRIATEAMSPQEREAEIAQLLAKRNAAFTAAPKANPTVTKGGN
jgi:hypothetical protein